MWYTPPVYYFFGAFATATAHAEADRRRSQELLDELESANQQLREYAAQAEELAAPRNATVSPGSYTTR